MGEIPLVDIDPSDVNDASDVVLALKPTLNGLAAGHNSLCKGQRKTYKMIGKVSDIANEANQRSKTNRWLIGGLIGANGGLLTSIIIIIITKYIGGS